MGGSILISMAMPPKAGVIAQGRCNPADPDDDAFGKFIEYNFDATEYPDRHSAIATTGFDPIRRSLDFGIFEDRPASRALQLRMGPMMSLGNAGGGQTSMYRRFAIAAQRSGLPNRLVAPVTGQSRLDAAILAPGANTVQEHRRAGFSDTLTRSGPGRTGFVGQMPQHSQAGLPMPRPRVNVTDTFAARFEKAFQAPALAPVLFRATNRSSATAEN